MQQLDGNSGQTAELRSETRLDRFKVQKRLSFCVFLAERSSRCVKDLCMRGFWNRTEARFPGGTGAESARVSGEDRVTGGRDAIQQGQTAQWQPSPLMLIPSSERQLNDFTSTHLPAPADLNPDPIKQHLRKIITHFNKGHHYTPSG